MLQLLWEGQPCWGKCVDCDFDLTLRWVILPVGAVLHVQFSLDVF